MQIPLQITVRDMPTSAALEDHIREKTAKLEQFYPPLMGCRIVVELPHKHKHQGKLFNVRIDLTVPGGEIVVNRDQSEDIYVALRDAFDAARRKLEDYGRRQRGDVKTHQSWPAATEPAGVEDVTEDVTEDVAQDTETPPAE